MVSKIVIIFALNMLLYAKTLNLKWVSDDITTYQNPPKWKNKWHKWWLWVLAQYKWREKYDHLLTTIIHSLVCVFIYLAFGSNNVSFWAAILFACNPANNQVSIWISGRGYALATLLLLISLYSPILAPFSLWACSYFNIGYLAPLALIGSSKWYLLALMPPIWWFWWKRFKHDVVFKSDKETVPEDRRFHLKKLILAIKTVGFYLTLSLIPFKITFYHSFLQSCAGNKIMKKRAYSFCKFFWIGLCAIGVWVYCAVTNWNIGTYGMLWFFITIAPFSNLRRIQQECAERYIYMANVGVMVALAYLISNNPILVAVFMTVYVTRLYTIYRMYTDDFWLLESAVYEDPGAWYAWHIRGFKRWENQSYREAITMWVMAHLLSPKEFKVLINISTALKVMHRDDEAEKYLKLAEENIIEGQEEVAKKVIQDFRNGHFPLLI